MSMENWKAAQQAGYDQQMKEWREKYGAPRQERERQEHEAQQAEETVKPEQEDGEIEETMEVDENTTVKAASNGIKSEPGVKDEDDEVTYLSTQKKTELGAERTKLAERQMAAEKELNKPKQPSTSERLAAGKAAQQADLRQKLTAKPQASGDRPQSKSSSTSSEDTPLNARRRKQDPVPRLNTSSTSNGRKSSGEASNVRSPKRTASSAFADDRRPSKRSGKSSLSSSEVSSPRSPIALSDKPRAREPPEWYQAMGKETARTKDGSGIGITLQSLKDQIRKAQKLVESRGKQGELNNIFTQVRDKLHTAFFHEVNPKNLKSLRILDNENGLPQIFDKNFAHGVDWPYDIKADAEELYNKWCRQDFLTDLMRGIKCGKPKNSKDARSSDSIDPGYPTISAKFYGNRHLLNGQWWPTQLTCLRDGAHAVSQAGIAGPGLGDDGKDDKKDDKSLENNIDEKKGAWSCIMSGGHGYGEDKDDGDEVWYCGTDCTDGSGQITKSTQKMMNSVGSKDPVRLIRSHKLPSKYAPKFGFRYDGLYDVVAQERVDPPGDPRARYRFKLVRRKDQDPIRGGDGPETRPTSYEIDAYEKDKRLRGF